MARSTRDKGKPGSILLMKPPELPAIQEQEPEEPPAEALPGKTTIVETATNEEIAQRKRGAKEPCTSFFAQTALIKDAEWERHKIYIYRLAPITDRTSGGNPKFLTIYREPIDEEVVLKDHGSGKYRCLLNQNDSKNNTTTIGRVEFEIENIKFPPVVPPGEWVDDKRNDRWAWAKEAIMGKPAAPSNNGTTVVTQPAGPTIREIVDGVKSINELTRANAPPPAPPAPDPADQFAKTVETVSRVVELARPPAPSPPDNSMQTFLLQQIADERSANRELMGKLLERSNAPAPPDPLRDLAMDLLKKKLEADPAAEAAAAQSRMNGTQELIAACVQALAKPAEKALDLFATMAANKQPPPAPQRPPGMRQPATTTAAPGQAQPPPAQPQAQAAPPPAAAPAEPEVEQLTPEQQMHEAKRQVMNAVLNHITPTMLDFLMTSDGTSFGAWFCDSVVIIPGPPPPFNRIPGLEAHAFANQYGKEAILAAYKGNPTLWAEIAPDAEAEQKFSDFLDEFLAYDPTVKEEEEAQQ